MMDGIIGIGTWKMTNKEAITWLSPKSSPEVIRDYKWKHGEAATMEKLNEAIDLACIALRKMDIKRVK